MDCERKSVTVTDTQTNEVEVEPYIIHEHVYSHLTSSSFVAAGKLVASSSRMQKILWFTFMFAMLLLTVVSLTNTISAYLKYGKYMQISIARNVKSDFPAITICNKSPFSKDALPLWKSGDIQSPMEFSRNIRNQLKHFWLENKFKQAMYSFFADTTNRYYSNLSYNDSIKVSHQVNKMLSESLVWKHREIISLRNSESYSNPSELLITRISHPRYFNCYRFQVNKRNRKKTEMLNFVIDLNNTLPFNSRELEGALTSGIHDQSAGLRVVIHENDHRPDIDTEGIDLQPNKKVDLVYQVELRNRKSTPKDPCFSREEMKNRKVKDFENEFEYRMRDCVSSLVNQHLIKYCSCMYRTYLKPQIPTPQIPYCLSTSPNRTDFKTRIRCIFRRHNLRRLPKFYQPRCLQRCHFKHYRHHASYSKWVATRWQVQWFKENIKTIARSNHLLKHHGNLSTNPKLQSEISSLKDMMTADNAMFPFKSYADKITGVTDNIVHLTVRRANLNVEHHDEKMLLPLTEVMSQIGGLLGLYLGLSLTFLVEIIDLLANVINTKTQYSKNRKCSLENNNTNYEL